MYYFLLIIFFIHSTFSCIELDSYQEFQCRKQIRESLDEAFSSDDISDGSVEKLQLLDKTCDVWKNCRSSVCPQIFQNDLLEKACNVLDFLLNEFGECINELQTSECYQNWNPILINKENKISECLKKTIIEACGKTSWLSFEKNILNNQ
ncbi:unnamed protein product [Caenorhabditis angaria]|uniref:T20D4.11-like domain-containing protein n=1 Tax=Caenorhabditis angaria TaxID=860376 RepID=A0A9P1I6V7_9PELO|nr:unnamed protein product [Caenorhabditis angaria]